MEQSWEISVLGPNVVLQRDVMIPMRDGVRLATNLYFPARNGVPLKGPFPVILERTPYNKNRHIQHLMGMFFAQFGYVCAVQDVRGRYRSEGEFAFLFNEKDEGWDGYDTLVWLGQQAWCNGRVGMTGFSYSGVVQQAVAVLDPPYLASQFIIDAGLNYWVNPLRQNGAFAVGLMLPYVFRLARDGKEAQADPELARLLDREYREIAKYMDRLPLKAGATPLSRAPSYEAWYLGMATRGDYDEFWQRPSATQEERIDDWKDIPVCLVTGWYGHHLSASVEKYRRLKKRLTSPVRLIVGPWMHSYDIVAGTWAGDVDFGQEASLGDLNAFRLRWFDQTLKGVDTGVLEGPSVQYFVMGGGSGRMTALWRMDHGGRWTAADHWPPPESRAVAYYLHPEGRLSLEVPETEGGEGSSTGFTFDPRDPVPTIGGNFQNPGVPGFIEGGAWDQRGRPDRFAACKDDAPLSSRPDVLVFQTPPLEEDVEVAGEIRVRLWVSSSAPDTDFTVKLVDVYPPNADYPEGYAMNIQDAIVRMRYRNGKRKAELIEPGQVYAVDVFLHSTANVFRRGHRIRVDISSSNFPLYDVNPNTGGPLGRPGPMQPAHNVVYHDKLRPSHILLPVKG